MVESGTGKSCQEENNFSLLHDEDDDSPSKLNTTNNQDTASDNLSIFYGASGNKYDSIVDEATKWINEMEQLRDSMVWHRVENSFHMDRLCMIAMIPGDDNDNIVRAESATH
jgi:hypothetical protein